MGGDGDDRSVPRTVCYDCGDRYGPERKRCDCGEPVWFDVDPPADPSLDPGDEGVWGFADWLPVAEPPDRAASLGRASGTTPLVRTPGLDEFAGTRAWVKCEWANPTGSFKDRGTAVGVAGALERGRDGIGTVSHGNMAVSTAAFGAAAGLPATVLVPADVPEERVAAIATYGPELLRIDGDYGRLYRETLGLSPSATGVEFVNSDTPLRVAGQKTTAFEVVAADPTPDAVVVPVSSGGHASAVWKGFREAAAAGVLADPPRIYLAQAAPCAPIAEADRDGRRVRPVEAGATVAYSIANADPPSGNRALAAVEATGGAVVAVPDDATTAARTAFARRAGMDVEAAPGVALAGTRTLVDRGELDPRERVAVVATGTGAREPRPVARDERPPAISLQSLSDRLRGDGDRKNGG